MDRGSLLVVDDEFTQLEILVGYLKKQGYNVFQANCGEKGFSIVQKNPIDLLITDMRMPVMDGLTLLKRVKEFNPDIGVIMMTAYGSIEDAVGAMKSGAEDYLQKPIDLEQLDIVVKKVLKQQQLVSENKALKAALHEKYRFHQFIVGSPQMEEVLNQAGRAAASKATVLIQGESGTGKEMLARALYLAGPRRGKPFIAVNMAAIPENLVESELFGHEKGAFTGADRQRKGRFEMADEGTLFIDEISEIPLSTQVKLLRVLQEQEFERVGGAELIKVNVRVLAATNQNLQNLITQGRFREDLFYRLNVIRIMIPPLRKRKIEIPLLVDHFFIKYGEEEDKHIKSISKEAMDWLMKYDYPGNIRELENIIQRAVVFAREDIITREDLKTDDIELNISEGDGETKTLAHQVQTLEKDLIYDALNRSDGNQSEAARMLGITERNLRYKLKKYQMK